MSRRSGYEAYPWFTLRAPLLPINTLQSIPESPRELDHFLRSVFSNPTVCEALLVGSFDFNQILTHEFHNTPKGKADYRILISFLRYFGRMSSRCTPFGTFAGFATGLIGDLTNIRIDNPENHEVHVRPDMEYLMSVARDLAAIPEIAESLLFTPNTSLYRVGSSWHYVQTHPATAGGNKVYDVVTAEDAGILEPLLEFCQSGRKLNEIRENLKTGGWDRGEIDEYVRALTREQVLVSQLEPVVCGTQFFDGLLDQLRYLVADDERIRPLARLHRLLTGIKHPGEISPLRNPVSAEAGKMSIKVNESHLIQADMNLSFSDLELDRNLANQVLLGIRISRALCVDRHPDPMKKFREAFTNRYGEREVMMVRVLDSETGIGLEGSVENYWTDPVPWIDDLHWRPGFNPPPVSRESGHPWLVSRLFRTVSAGDLYLDIQEQDLQDLNIHAGIWPGQIWTLAELLDRDGEGRDQVYISLTAPGHPAAILGRFGFADPGKTTDWMNRLVQDETDLDPGKIYAEVVHLPEDRTGNVLQRPSIYEYDIPYLARSEKPADKQIRISDILVSVRNDRVVLTSASTGKEIVPRMTNAYNHNLGNLPVYKFLHRVQLQDNMDSWLPSWGNAARIVPYTPGIRFRNLILLAPSWTFRPADLQPWISVASGRVDKEPLRQWKEARFMPDEMVWMLGDQDLYFSWKNTNLILAFWDAIHAMPLVTVRPFYARSTPVKGASGTFANQIVLCYKQV
ncbi:MAG: hypothetical protein A2X22_01360 [Bacteroidetes bacterium GWF2_49_14]|nr:MAG: hypothetical protein A2X22_01360 [Bacteroidetes bacterium GWF2_49_14]HBB93372.1 hypothetical protein [Bacteroidales bacterium]